MPAILKTAPRTYSARLAGGRSLASGLVWLRRDLRVEDHAALYHALRSCRQVHVAFVFDTAILDALPGQRPAAVGANKANAADGALRSDRRVAFIRESAVQVDAALRQLAGQADCGLITLHGVAQQVLPKLAQALGVQAVYAAHDDEPAAVARDAQVRGALADAGISFRTVKDHLVFERDEVVTLAGTPYSVFTPYKNAWLKQVDAFYLRPYPVERHADALAPRPAAHRQPVPTLEALGFAPTDPATAVTEPGLQGGEAAFDTFFERIHGYGTEREFPALDATSHLGVHLRFGTVSVRRLAGVAHQLALHGNQGAAVWLNELIWRDFYAQVLYHHPRIAQGEPCAAFKPAYERIAWQRGKQADALFAAWCEGRTGHPIVDAAMAQINATGFMHNRLRMVTASFLIKHLGIDWRRGEAYFANHLNDYELASNNGGWQWAASSGCDAQPYFRIFNPVTQSEKFDARGDFIRRWVPALAGLDARAVHAPWKARPAQLEAAGIVLGRDYPKPIVEHEDARAATLERYAVVREDRRPLPQAQPLLL